MRKMCLRGIRFCMGSVEIHRDCEVWGLLCTEDIKTAG